MTLDRVQADLSIDRAWAHLEWLAREAPARLAGTPGQERAAAYFAERLDGYGLETHLDTFAAYRSVPVRGALHVTSPAAREIRAEACGHILSTPDEGLDADLIDVASGDEAAYAGRDVVGKAVLTDIGVGPARPEKARIAARRGAAAVVFVNWGRPEFGTIPAGAIKSVWGNPTRESIAEVPQVAALGISRADGDALRADLARGPVRVRVIAQATRDWGPLVQPWARLRAPGGDGTFLIVGGHHDAWEPGMTDNAAGNALTLELARVFAQHRHALGRDVVFAFWNGHEIGDYEGSTWFVDRYWDQIDRDAVAYFNVDSVGMAGSSHYLADSTPELRRFHLEVETRVLGCPTGHRHLARDNEHPFFPIGLPALEGRYHFGEEQIAAWGGARGGWWWHSSADTLDKVDRSRFFQTVRVYAGYAWEMCSRAVLPYDFTATAVGVGDRVSMAQALAADCFALELPMEEFTAAAADLEKFLESAARRPDADRTNRALMQVSRLLLPAFETFGGRYTQDRTSHDALAAPVPALAGLGELAAADPDSEAFHLLWTEIRRQRNRLSDALRGATGVIRDLVER